MRFIILNTRYILLTCIICMCSLGYGQLSRPGNPIPLNYKGSKQLEIYDIQIPKELVAKTMEETIHPWLKQAGSGLMINVDFDIHKTGIWDTLLDGTKLWRAGFRVKGASAISIVFEPYKVNKGVSVFLYDYNQQKVLGAFTDMNNKSNGILATAPLFNDMVIVEVQVPHYLDHEGSIMITKIGCDLQVNNITTALKDGYFGLSGGCNEDINCYDNPVYQQLKYSVVRIIYAGVSRCTGSLVNNMQQDGRNYVITAEHCISDEETANSSVFYFDYESPFCEGPDGNSSMSLSGATIRAKGTNIDFVLLELLEPLPFYYHPYYAGWDVTDNQPLSGISIHHPQGDVKKIAFENDPLTTATFSSAYITNSHWRVSRWESGTTEQGSSGGAFFDQNNRIVGTLTGGQAQCGNPVNDFFQKMSYSWDYYPENTRQLKYWLDPLGGDPYFIDGFDPYEEFWKSGDTLTNIQETEMLVVEENGLSWGYLSGHNSDYLTQFAEQYTTEEKKSLFGVLLNISHNYIASASSHLVLKVWQGATTPETIIYEKDVPLPDLMEGTVNLVELNSAVSVSDTFYVGYELYYDSPQDTFALWMAENRAPQQENTAFVFDGTVWWPLDDYTSGAIYSSFDIKPVVYDTEPVPEPEDNVESLIQVYPNPLSDECWIKFREMTAGSVKLKLYNLSGQLIYEEVFPPYQTLIHLRTRSLSTGVYILKIVTDEGTGNAKLIIIK